MKFLLQKKNKKTRRKMSPPPPEMEPGSAAWYSSRLFTVLWDFGDSVVKCNVHITQQGLSKLWKVIITAGVWSTFTCLF